MAVLGAATHDFLRSHKKTLLPVTLNRSSLPAVTVAQRSLSMGLVIPAKGVNGDLRRHDGRQSKLILVRNGFPRNQIVKSSYRFGATDSGRPCLHRCHG